MLEEVTGAGAAAFQRLRVRDTDGARGVLLYVSLRERMAWVVGDDAIGAEVRQEQWDQIRDAIVTGFRRGSPKMGLIDAIMKTGSMLGERFPREEGDANELPDTLHLID